MVWIGISSLFLALLPLALTQDQCEVSRLVKSPRRTAPHIEDSARPEITNGQACGSDPRRESRRMRLNINVQSASCEPVANARIFLSQADSHGNELADCGGEISTLSYGSGSVMTVTPGRYHDIKHPGSKRPRLFQLEVRAPAGCAYAGLEEDEPYFTQFYFRKDKTRHSDPCPNDQCHADKPKQILTCSRIAGLRQCTARITVPQVLCEHAPTFSRSMPTRAMPVEPVTTEPVCTRPSATQWDTPGPFYIDNQPYRNPMCSEDINHASTTKLKLHVRLTDRSCRTLTGFNIDVWSANSQGQYVPYCRSLLPTNGSGMFTLDTLKPGRYPGRPQHLHFLVHGTKVGNMCYREFTTQSYFPERFDYSALVKSCRDRTAAGGTSTDLECDFPIILNDPRPC
ncbi:uncharacterized protein LOC135823267 isoform X1 [Sycon ciliatum]|uniref:uncharacterized protein LOC135823267 isoform X1 n=1 Tax=Sycon ciliatum TaxID=27933 RepID=UPI0031F6A350